MALFDPSDAAGALERLLERERRDLLAGDLTALAGHARQKARLAAQLEKTPAGEAALARIRAMAVRNGALLAAARDGVAAALHAVEGRRKAGADLATYDRAGRRNAIAGGQPGFEKRT